MNRKIILSLILSTVALGGCDTVKEKVGLTRHAPDEFSVMQRAPLEIPSDLTSLPRPQPGMQRPQETTARQQAQNVILGTKEKVVVQQSSAESGLLQKAGAQTAKADIRATLNQESKEKSEDKRAVVKKLLSLGDEVSNDSVVDAEAEAKRIQDAKKAGKPVTTGETPVLKE